MRLFDLVFPLLTFSLLTSCNTLDRLFRISPLMGREIADKDRVNIWPIYYQAGDKVAVLWPVFDLDDEGFAFRPILVKDGKDWGLLSSCAGWNTEKGTWWALPAYKTATAHGIFPVYGWGERFRQLGPVWWEKKDGEVQKGGFFPVCAFGRFNHIGPAWWLFGTEEEVTKGGFFPLYTFGSFNNVGPVFWTKDEEDELEQLGAVPLFYYSSEKDRRLLITPLGGRAWSPDGSKGFVNILGPLYHYDDNGEESYAAFLWPVFTWSTGEDKSYMRVFPIFGYRQDGDRTTLTALAGLWSYESGAEDKRMRFSPLFSYGSGANRGFDLYDFFSLYSLQSSAQCTQTQVGTPIVFYYESNRDEEGKPVGSKWSGLLGTLYYEGSTDEEGVDESQFNFLYYLYRMKSKGEEVRRDFFPFFTWDSGKEHSAFSFLWRVFHWERNGDKTKGHILFIPWGDA